MPIWKTPATLEDLRERSRNTLMEHLGIEYLEIGDDYLKARMPVDDRTKQTAGILHGGPRRRWPRPWGASQPDCAWTGSGRGSWGSKLTRTTSAG